MLSLGNPHMAAQSRIIRYARHVLAERLTLLPEDIGFSQIYDAVLDSSFEVYLASLRGV